MKQSSRIQCAFVPPHKIDFIRSDLHAGRPISVCRHRIATTKCSAPVCIALITDLHNSDYGEKQQQLLSAVAQTSPDIIALCGDIFDDHEHETHALGLLHTLAKNGACYYVVGNHEQSHGHVEAIKLAVRRCGITVLSNATADIAVPGGTIRLFGLDDYPKNSVDACTMERQLTKLTAQLDANTYNVLLHHRPEQFFQLLPRGFDLMLSGHTHGGQWRVPFAQNGLYAPGQGLFPKYAGGHYTLFGRSIIISRGLSKKPAWIPRIGNPPELAVIELVPSSI